MRNPIHKSNIRKPLKGILFIFLLSMVSSAFVSSATQFLIVIEKLIGLVATIPA